MEHYIDEVPVQVTYHSTDTQNNFDANSKDLHEAEEKNRVY